jgi:hypothetical protein
MTLCRFSSFVPISFVPSTHAAPAEITEVDKPSNNELTTDACGDVSVGRVCMRVVGM